MGRWEKKTERETFEASSSSEVETYHGSTQEGHEGKEGAGSGELHVKNACLACFVLPVVG